MQFIDTHIHLQDFKTDFAPQVLENPSLKGFVSVAASEEDFAKIAKLADAMPAKVVPAFGVHPWHYRVTKDTDLLREYLRRFPQALVGEIGVDGIKEPPSAGQHALFSKQLAVAKEFSRPVIIHGAKALTAFMLHEAELKEVKFVYHGFVKNRELIKFINKCGGYFGLGAHFLRQEKAREIFLEMPKEKFLFETDAPYQVSEDTYAEVTAENLLQLVRISGMTALDLEEQLLQNTKDFLRC